MRKFLLDGENVRPQASQALMVRLMAASEVLGRGIGIANVVGKIKGILFSSECSELLVFLVSDHLKMDFVDTQAVIALVVDLFLSRNETVLVRE